MYFIQTKFFNRISNFAADSSIVRLVLITSLMSVISCSTNSTSTNSSVSSQDNNSSARPVEWGYSGENSPATWGQLSPLYSACSEGVSQSPIDIELRSVSLGKDLNRKYNHSSLTVAHHEHVEDILDNGHTIQVTYDEGSWITQGDKKFELKQFHFHTPSEHTFNNKYLPMEMHLVHQSLDGKYAVLSVLFEEGKHNKNFESLIQNLPSTPGESKHLEHVKINVDDLLPDSSAEVHYKGSFTTPPCTEGIEWLVMSERITISKRQIAAFAERLNANNRPIQPLNGRVVATEVIAR